RRGRDDEGVRAKNRDVDCKFPAGEDGDRGRGRQLGPRGDGDRQGRRARQTRQDLDLLQRHPRRQKRRARSVLQRGRSVGSDEGAKDPDQGGAWHGQGPRPRADLRPYQRICRDQRRLPVLKRRARMADIKLTLVVACALVDADKRVLIAQRPEGKALAGLWEFPGGKVEPGERPEQTLIRELHEEIGIDVSEPCLAPLTFASYAYDTFHLLMPFYIHRRCGGLAGAREGHQLAGVPDKKLGDYPMPTADIPLIPHLIDVLM